MARILIAVPACHFANAKTICTTTHQRLEKALELAKGFRQVGNHVRYVVSGAVCYQGGQPPRLNELMRDFLVAHGVSPDHILLGSGIGIADDAENVMDVQASAVSATYVVVVSSRWYLFAALPFWTRYARIYGVGLGYLSIPRTGGLRTWVTYLAYGIFNRVMLAFGSRHWLENLLRRIQARRVQAFTWNGCA